VGEKALRVAGQILPGMNLQGSVEATVEGGNQPSRNTTVIPIHSSVPRRERLTARAWFQESRRGTLQQLPSEILLALEMISHEGIGAPSDGRRSTNSRASVARAEEIAGISDDMFLPEDVSKALD